MSIAMALFALILTLVPFVVLLIVLAFLVLFAWAFVVDTGIFNRRNATPPAAPPAVQPKPQAAPHLQAQ